MDNQSPLVSIILPTYNRAEFLKHTIESVLKQGFHEWELIIWDDGSTDRTKQVVESFNDERIVYIYMENHGVAYARNRGMEMANGKYIAFLDSDDEWLPEKIQREVQALLENQDLDLVFTNFLNINIKDNRKDVEFDQYASILSGLKTEERKNNVKVITDHFLECLAKENFIATDSVMLKSELIKSIGGFNETLRNSEDFELWWRVGLEGAVIAYLNEVLLIRNKPPDSLSSRSIIAAINSINALDIIEANTISHRRIDLVKIINSLRQKALYHLTLAYGTSGQKKEALHAYLASLKYGIRPGSMKLLLKALLSEN